MSSRGWCSWLVPAALWLLGVLMPLGAARRADIGQCAGPRENQGSPESVLPALTPISASSSSVVMQAYEVGMQQCKDNFDRLQSEYEAKNAGTKPIVQTDDDSVETYPEYMRCHGIQLEVHSS